MATATGRDHHKPAHGWELGKAVVYKFSCQAVGKLIVKAKCLSDVHIPDRPVEPVAVRLPVKLNQEVLALLLSLCVHKPTLSASCDTFRQLWQAIDGYLTQITSCTTTVRGGTQDSGWWHS